MLHDDPYIIEIKVDRKKSGLFRSDFEAGDF
jgi:hypothetical protein